MGTQTALWGITAGVYLAGPAGMKEVGQTILYKSAYLANRLREVKGVAVKWSASTAFKELTVDFDGTGKTVREINQALLARNIFGGVDLSGRFPELGECALYCVTEITTQQAMDTLIDALQEIVG